MGVCGRIRGLVCWSGEQTWCLCFLKKLFLSERGTFCFLCVCSGVGPSSRFFVLHHSSSKSPPPPSHVWFYVLVSARFPVWMLNANHVVWKQTAASFVQINQTGDGQRAAESGNHRYISFLLSFSKPLSQTTEHQRGSRYYGKETLVVWKRF